MIAAPPPRSELAINVAGRPSVRLSPTFWSWSQRLAATAALVLLSPLFLVMFVLVKTGSRGPFMFRQERPGLQERSFTIYKIRTLAPGSDRATTLGVTRTDPRITRVGRLLRDFKLDELPQLINVARGDMELVGPRPVPMGLHDKLCEVVPGFRDRYRVRPGLTNISQVSISDNALDERLAADWATRLEGERHYIGRKSVKYDLLMIVMTALFLGRRLWCRLTAAPAATPPPEGSIPTTLVAGTAIANLDYDGVVRKVGRWIDDGAARYICICSVHSVVEAHWHREHREALDGSDLNTADGMPVVWAQRMFGHRQASRVYGPTLMMHLLERAVAEGWRVALYGGHEDRNRMLVDRLRSRFPELQIVATVSPPFRALEPEEDEQLTATLRDARPDLVLVGLGCPRQERWMHAHVDRLPAVLVGVGAAFDFHAGAVSQAPPLLQRLGLEWAFRLACEPKRLFRRYATTNPAFIVLMARQWVAARIGRRRFQVHRDPRSGDPMPRPARDETPASYRFPLSGVSN